MGIFWHVPGFDNYGTDARNGDNQFFIDKRPDGKLHILSIDGYDGEGVTRFLRDLNIFKANTENAECWDILTHGHYDHYKGIKEHLLHKTNGKYTYNITRLYMQDPASLKVGLRSNKGSSYVQNAIDTLYKIKEIAENRGTKVIFVKNKQTVKWGDLKWVFYREQPTKVEDDDRYGDAYLNDGSIVTWFPELSYLTSGDGPMQLGTLCKKYGLNPKFIKGPHHGNNLPRVQATIMWNLGTRYYWDNDLSKNITDFLQTGREDAIGVGMKVLNAVGDINGLFHKGHAYIYKNGKLAFSYDCAYQGNSFVTQKTIWWIVDRILKGTYGKGDRIITYCIARGYAPSQAIKTKNKAVKLAKDILSGAVDYGTNQDRWNRIDKELGKGYGKLVQTIINCLAGVDDIYKV